MASGEGQRPLTGPAGPTLPKEVVRFRRGCTVVIYASLSLWESRAEGSERATAPPVVEFTAGSEDPPRPLRGRPSRTREGEAKLICPNGS